MKTMKILIILIIIGFFVWVDVTVFQQLINNGENGVVINGKFIPFSNIGTNKIEDYLFLVVQTLTIGYYGWFKINSYISLKVKNKQEKPAIKEDNK